MNDNTINNHSSPQWVWIKQARDQAHQSLNALPVEKLPSLKKWIYEQLANEHSDYHKKLLFWAMYAFDLIDDDLMSIALNKKRMQLVEARKDSGVRCPCCDQYVKEYKRTLSANMCNFLQSLVVKSAMDQANGGDGWVHFKECAYGSHDYPYVVDWLLAERSPSTSKKKRSSGLYKPTNLGIDFVFGRATVPKYIYTYNGKRTGEDTSEMINFKSVKIEHFDLEKMLAGVVPQSEEKTEEKTEDLDLWRGEKPNIDQGSLFDR